MFLKKVVERNPSLVEAGFHLMNTHTILPDTYVVDVDQFVANAKAILEKANLYGIDLYFMLKQIGRNPYLAKKLVELGYPGAVAVDYREAEVLMAHDIPISNIGHLVQVPQGFLERVVAYEPDYLTVFSLDKIEEIEKICAKLNKKQKVLLKVVGEDDVLYTGQFAGFELKDLDQVVETINKFDHIQIGGVTSFPCFLVDETSGKAKPTPNLETLLQAKAVLKAHGIEDINVNAPPATCIETLEEMAACKSITSAEPGHGLSGTTPLHAHRTMKEIPCVIYMSEISHNFKEHAYSFGGGHYRRSHIQYALVGRSLKQAEWTKVLDLDPTCIDYYFELERSFPVSYPVCMAFRFQIFVTRSHVALLEGLHHGDRKRIGLYDSQGRSIVWEDLS